MSTATQPDQVIAEDSVLLRVGLIKVLEMGGFQVAAEADDAEGLLAAVAEHRRELALIDVRMPPGLTDEGRGRRWRSAVFSGGNRVARGEWRPLCAAQRR